MSFTTYLRDKLLDVALRRQPYEAPETVWMGLLTASPDGVSPPPEVRGKSYSRQGITFSAAKDGKAASAADVQFPVAREDWGPVVAFGLFDQAKGGNLLLWGLLSESRDIVIADIVRIKAGELQVGLE